jgi:hypothetical protein
MKITFVSAEVKTPSVSKKSRFSIQYTAILLMVPTQEKHIFPLKIPLEYCFSPVMISSMILLWYKASYVWSFNNLIFS